MKFPLWLVGTGRAIPCLYQLWGLYPQILSCASWVVFSHTGVGLVKTWGTPAHFCSSLSLQLSALWYYALWTPVISWHPQTLGSISSAWGGHQTLPESMFFVPQSGGSLGRKLSVVTSLVSCLSWVTALCCSASSILKLSLKIFCPAPAGVV